MPLDRHHGDAVAGPHPTLPEPAADDLHRSPGLPQREVLFNLHVVEHPPRQQVGYPLSHVVLGQDDVVGADLLEDAAVAPTDGLRPDMGHPHVHQQGRGENALLEMAADRHHCPGELVRADLAQRLVVRGVSDHGVREDVGIGLHAAGIVVHAQHFPAVRHQCLGQ